jgi:3-oxoadipate enol-lactonase
MTEAQTPPTPRLATYSSRGLRLAYLDAGPAPGASGAAPTLLFLHGFPFSKSLWDPQVAALSPTHRCLAPDLAGFGDSEACEGICRMEDYAADALALLDHAGVDRAVVCGLSMGGYVALALAAAAPERLRGLVLADTRAGADSPEAAAGRHAAAEQVLAEGTGAFAPGFLPKALGASTPAERPAVRARVEALVLEAAPSAVAAAQRGMAVRPDRHGILPGLAVPVLIVVGEEDVITPPAESRRMAEAIAGSRLVVLPAAGHLANLENPAAFNRELAGFLATL